MKRKSKQKGFTLVELIVVIVIILILAALLIPFLLRYVEKAKEANCRSGMSSLLTDYSAGVAEGAIDPDKDQDIGDLQKAGLISDFSCPSDGELYIKQDKDGVITIRCTYHDDGKKDSGSSGKFPGSDTFKKLQEFIETDWSGKRINNDNILREYFKKYGKNLENVKVDDAISSSQREKLIDEIAKKTGISRDTLTSAFDAFQGKEYSAVPYVTGKTGEVIMYYSTNGLENDRTHDPTNLLYYNGSWYFYPNMNGSKNQFSPGYILPSLGNSDDVQKALEANGCIKIQ